PWNGPALVDGRLWPVASDTMVWLPRGAHSIERSARPPVLRLLDLNGELKSANATATGLEFAYQSSARAMARLDLLPPNVEIDGLEAHPPFIGNVLLLPRGQHLVTLALH